MRLAVVVLLVTGCRLHFFERGDDTLDAPPMANDADLNVQLGPWGPSMLVSELSSAIDPDDDPTLTSDQLQILFDSGRFVSGGAAGDVWVATRASTAEPFGTPTVVSEFLSPSDDSTGDLSLDGLRIYLGTDRLVSGDRDIYVAKRSDRQSPWGALARVTALSATGASDAGVCESGDGLSVIIGSDRNDPGDLFFATRASTTSPFTAPQPIAEINTPDEESQQWCNADLTLVYFSRRNAAGDYDIWFASRPDPGAPFGPPQQVVELSTSSDDADPWVSPDLKTMYFARGPAGDTDIYISTR